MRGLSRYIILGPPDEALIIRVLVPVGVPPNPGTSSAPQEAHSAANSSVAASTGHTLCGISLPAHAVLRRKASANATVMPNPNSHGIPDCGPEGSASREGAVVVTLTMMVTSVVPSSVTILGVTVQVALAGAPVQVSVTVPTNLAGVRMSS